jgi:very-short-patch-repair endonuclease
MAHASFRMRSHARDMRREPTAPEARVWWWLRDRRFDGYKFRRQVPFGPYILDFYCAELKLAVELDGAQHGTIDMSEYDSARTLFLRRRGIAMVRIPNELTQGDGNDGAGCIRIAIAQITESNNR